MISGEVSAFDEAIVPLRLRSTDGRLFEVEALVDTGFTGWLTLGRDGIDALGLQFRERQRVRLGDDRSKKMSLFTGIVVWDEQEFAVPVLASEQGAIIGMRLLRGHRLFVDVVDGGEVLIERRAQDGPLLSR